MPRLAMQAPIVPLHAPNLSQLASDAESWFTSLQARNASHETIDQYGQSIKQFDRFLEARQLPRDTAAITRRDVEAFSTSILTTHTSRCRFRPADHTHDKTAVTRLSALRSFFNWAVAEDIIEKSPMAGMLMPTVRETPPDVLTPEQVARLFEVTSGKRFIDRRDNAILRLLFDTGMRRSECGNLRVEDVDLVQRVAVVLGKGNRVRVVPFGANTAQAIDRYLRVRRTHRLAHLRSMWVSQWKHFDGDSIGAMVQARGREAGIDRLHAHQFRHTYADAQLRAGMTEGDLMQTAGWRNSLMLRRYGAKVAADRAREAYHRLRAPGDRL